MSKHPIDNFYEVRVVYFIRVLVAQTFNQLHEVTGIDSGKLIFKNIDVGQVEF